MQTEEPRVVSTLYFAAEPNAASLTRALVRLVLTRWGLPEVIEDAVLVASELASNAIQATLDSDSGTWINYSKLPPLIGVQVALYDSFMLLNVWDRSHRVPQPGNPAAIDEGGRGLLIVENLSTRWGLGYGAPL